MEAVQEVHQWRTNNFNQYLFMLQWKERGGGFQIRQHKKIVLKYNNA